MKRIATVLSLVFACGGGDGARGPATVRVSFTGDTDQVLVLSEPRGISCARFPKPGGTSCEATFSRGTAVRLRAISVICGFSWSEPCSGKFCDLDASSDQTVTISIFSRCTTQPAGRLEVALDGPGRVTSDTVQIDCGEICEAAVASNTEIVLTAEPDPGARFVGWRGDCSGTGDCRVHSPPPWSVSAQFAR